MRFLTISFILLLAMALSTHSSLAQESPKAQEAVLQVKAESQPMSQKAPKLMRKEISDSSSSLSIQADPRFEAYMEEYLEEKKVMGYRLQLYSGNKRADAEQVRLAFITKYEKERPDLIYQQPNFKIRVGNYRNRLEATKYLMLYKIDFPSAFIVQDAIHFEEEPERK